MTVSHALRFSQDMPDGEKSFSCRLHDQEVKAFCHDAMNMAQLPRGCSRSYGAFRF